MRKVAHPVEAEADKSLILSLCCTAFVIQTGKYSTNAELLWHHPKMIILEGNYWINIV